MQRLIAQPALRRALPAVPPSLRLGGRGAGASALAPLGRGFCSERHWGRRAAQTALEPAPVAMEKFRDGPQQIEFWQNDLGALVAQHDEIEDIESCRWAISCVDRQLRQPEPSCTNEERWSRLMAMRFLLDLEERVEKLSDEGYGTCAVDLFERPWVVTRNDGKEVLRLRPRPDGLLKRAALAVMSPVIAPAGALVTYVKSGSANSVAAFKWYFRAIAEVPSTVRLDSCYRVQQGGLGDRDACMSSSTSGDLRRLVSVQRPVPQFGL